MATPTPTPTRTPNIKSAARKLPIKRKSLSPPHPDPIAPNPNPNPVVPPDPLTTPKPEPYAADNGYDDEYDDEEAAEEEEEQEQEEEGFGVGIGGAVVGAGGGDGDLKPPPFKFHRIWSESDEIRFLQGLLGCWSQGLVFPRDLNLFYDRFSETMPQPFTRSQLSEKLRRLRTKFRNMSGRIARGQDPNRLSPHDRDLLHLCTRLWDPSYASSSPFSAPEGAPAPVGNKRRRPNPRTPSGLAPQLQLPPLTPIPTPLALPDLLPPALLLSPAPAPPPPPPATDEKVSLHEDGNFTANSLAGGIDVEERKPLSQSPSPTPPSSGTDGAVKKGTAHLLTKTVLDVFDASLNELRATLFSNELLQPENTSSSSSTGSDFSKRWQEQRLLELELLGRRFRLVLEDTMRV